MPHPLDQFDANLIEELADILTRMYPPVLVTSAGQIPSNIQDAASLGIKVGQASVAHMLREHVDMRHKRAMEN